MILVELSKNKGKARKIKVTLVEAKGGRPKKKEKLEKARHDFEEDIKAELLEDQGGDTR